MKKLSITSLVIVFALIFTMVFGTGASAADVKDKELTAAEADSAVTEIVKQFTGSSADAEVILPQKLAGAMDENGDGTITVGEAADTFSGLVYAAEEDLSDAERIAEAAQYRITVLEDGRKTVYIFVDVKNNPELLDFNVFADAAMYIYQKQNEVAAADGGELSLLTYEQISGELALHTIVYAATNALGGADEGSIFHDYYQHAQSAQLNIDETRAPAWLVTLLGQLIAFFRAIFS